VSLSSKIAKNSFFAFWIVLLTVGSSLALSTALARKLGPGQYGSYSFAIWLVGLGALLSNLGISVASTKFISEFQGAGDQRGLRWVVRSTLRSRVLVAVAVAVGLVPISMVLVGNDGGSSVHFYPLLISLALVPYALHQAFQGILKGFQRYEYAALALSVGLLLKAFIAVALVWLGYGILQLLALEVAVWTLAAALGLRFLRRMVEGPFLKPAGGPSQEARRSLTRFAVMGSITLLMDFIIVDRSELFFLKLFRPDEEVGYYSLAFAMATYPVMLIPGALGSALMPAISEQFGRRDNARLASIYVTSARYLMMLAFPIVAGGIVMARPLALFVFGQEYAPMVLPAQILMGARATYAISLATSAVIWGTNRPHLFLLLNMIEVPANIIACILLIPAFGMKGAALAQLAGVPTFGVTLWYISTRLRLSWPYKDAARLALASAVMALGVAFLRGYMQASAFIPVLILLGAAIYLVQLPLLRVLRREDLELIDALSSRVPVVSRLRRRVRLFQGVEPRSGTTSASGPTPADSPEMAGAGEPGA